MTHVYQSTYGPPSMQIPYQYYQYLQPNQQLPFMATLDFPYLSRLINDPIHHDPSWPTIPVKLPLNIPTFNNKPSEDPKSHVMTYHLWCLSNSLMDGSIRLRHFQRTLTGTIAKWYIEFPWHSFWDFNILVMEFFTHFQLPIRYEMSTNILNSLH